MYCSELVYKIVRDATQVEVGQLARLRDFDLGHPKVKQKLRERYGTSIPLDEVVVSPEAMFTSPLLVTVFEQ